MIDHAYLEKALSTGRPPNLTHSWSEGRALTNVLLTIGAWIVALLGSVPLVSVL